MCVLAPSMYVRCACSFRVWSFRDFLLSCPVDILSTRVQALTAPASRPGVLGATLDASASLRRPDCARGDVIRNPGATKRTMHFARWMHYARELCLLNRIRMFLVGTDAMVADIFTKPLDKTAFLRCRDYLMAMTE